MTTRRRPAGKDAPTEVVGAAPQKEIPHTGGGCPVSFSFRKGESSWMRKFVIIVVPALLISIMHGYIKPRELAFWGWGVARDAMGYGKVVYSAEDLRKINTLHHPHLSILGEVYDVTEGKKHYQEGGPYNGFTGTDGSRAFITGDFTEKGFTDDLTGLSPQQCLGLEEWADMYRNNPQYHFRGILSGAFYDRSGRQTKGMAAFKKCVVEGRRERKREEQEKKLYPSCNSRWTPSEGGRVWCTDTGKVPRKIPAAPVHGLAVMGQGHSHGHAHRGGAGGKGVGEGDPATPAEEEKDAAKAKGRCACFDPAYAAEHKSELLSYKDCFPQSNSCVTKPPSAG